MQYNYRYRNTPFSTQARTPTATLSCFLVPTQLTIKEIMRTYAVVFGGRRALRAMWTLEPSCHRVSHTFIYLWCPATMSTMPDTHWFSIFGAAHLEAFLSLSLTNTTSWADWEALPTGRSVLQTHTTAVQGTGVWDSCKTKSETWSLQTNSVFLNLRDNV